MTPAEHLETLEALRRVGDGATSVTMDPIDEVDYASAGVKIDLAVTHLNESIPNRQVERTQAAMVALTEGVAELQLWLFINGW